MQRECHDVHLLFHRLLHGLKYLAPLLDETIERHIVEYGVTEFVVGQHGRFDQLAAEALRREKRGLLQVTLLASPADRT